MAKNSVAKGECDVKLEFGDQEKKRGSIVEIEPNSLTGRKWEQAEFFGP